MLPTTPRLISAYFTPNRQKTKEIKTSTGAVLYVAATSISQNTSCRKSRPYGRFLTSTMKRLNDRTGKNLRASMVFSDR